MSRGFICAMIGIAVTILSWYGPWEWPAWPAFAVLYSVFDGSYHDLEPAGRGAVIVLLIAVNVTAWAVASNGLWSLAHRLLRTANGERRPA